MRLSSSAAAIWSSGWSTTATLLAEAHLAVVRARSSESLASLERLFPVARNQGIEISENVLRMWAMHQAELLGDAAAAMAHARRMLESTQNAGVVFPGDHYCLGVAHLLEGNSREAASCLERAIAIQQEMGGLPPFEMVNALSRLAVAYADLGQSERARGAAARGLAFVRERQLPVFVALALIMQAQVLRKTQGAEAREEIQSALAEAEALVESTGIRSWQPFIHVERAELARLLGNETTRKRELREAHRLFTAMGATAHAEQVASTPS